MEIDLPKHLAIAAFCKIIDGLPAERRRMALDFTCAALGQTPERTGLRFSVDRPLLHMYWDVEIENLYERLEYLVECVGVKEQLAVQGAVSYIETHFAQWADERFSQSCTNGFRRTIEQMQHQLTLPVEARNGMRQDAQINEFIEKLHQLVDSAESRRLDAKLTFEQLRSEFEAVFTLEFWDLLNHLGVEEMRPEIEKLLGEEDENAQGESDGDDGGQP